MHFFIAQREEKEEEEKWKKKRMRKRNKKEKEKSERRKRKSVFYNHERATTIERAVQFFNDQRHF